MLILGIETSCDETAIAVVRDGRQILSNVISSQVEVHARYGGVVPEVASRQHMLAITPIYRKALAEAGVAPNDLDAIAVTAGPGLAGSLLVGVNYAKGIALGLGAPLYGMNHLEGHMYAGWLEEGPTPEDAIGFPMVCLLVSGGHTELVLMRGHGDYELLGSTRDDAAGEAFDKAARVLGLGYPGGPAIQKTAALATRVEPLPRAWMRGTLEFSFSGLKTAVLNKAREQGVAQGEPWTQADVDPSKYAQDSEYSKDIDEKRSALAAGFQEAVVDVLVRKTLEAVEQYDARGIIVGGGVSANAVLRATIQEKSPVPVAIPRPVLCTDNGAMIAAAAFYGIQRGLQPDMAVDANPRLSLGP
ncbi:MAG: tRNA (adenosine(37)-N6)-threonylcarbamoyltransferase complex transferase subunit TsaD [SAR202 cluster bacterium]|nr:tRNA (adenosine(37)-N6)-threonylcarbamoyltransferase complex transferase subunit TsaD [SAR202 cluster bacterium]